MCVCLTVITKIESRYRFQAGSLGPVAAAAPAAAFTRASSTKWHLRQQELEKENLQLGKGVFKGYETLCAGAL